MSRVRIFVSSPADVEHERSIVKDVIDRLAREFLPYFPVESILWEEEALTADRNFQAGLIKPSDCEIVLVVLWTRLGSPLPEEPYGGMTGTEWEFFDAVEGVAEGRRPEVLVYKKTNPKLVDITDPQATHTAIQERQRLEAFFERHFFNPDKTFRRAFRTFDSDSAFRTLVEVQLRKLLNRRVFVERRGAERAFEWHGSPFRPNDPFDVADERIFTGREAEIGDLLHRLSEQTKAERAFLLVSGPSGCGKSSLIRAGLLPRLARPDQIEGVAACRWCLVDPGSGADPVGALAEALCAPGALGDTLRGHGVDPALLRRTLKAEPALAVGQVGAALQGLTGALREDTGETGAVARLLVVVDPVDPLTAAGADPAFGAALDALARSGLAWVVAAMRSDQLGGLPRMGALARDLDASAWLRIEPPASARIRQVIEIPALVAGLDYESEAGRDPAEELEAEAAGVRLWPPLLQGALEHWYGAVRGPDAGDEPPGHVRARAANVLRAGGGLAGDALRRAEALWAGLDETARAALPRLCRALIALDPAPGARPTPRGADLDALESDPACRRLTRALIEARLAVAEGVHDPVLNTPCPPQDDSLRALLGRVVRRTGAESPVRSAGAGEEPAPDSGTGEPKAEVAGLDWQGYRRTLTLAHPGLIGRWGPMRDWLAAAENREALRVRRQLSRQAELWKRTDCNQEHLLGEAGYSAARRFAERHGAELEPAEAELLAQSAQQLRLQRRRNRLVRMTGLVLAGLLLVATVAAFWARDASRKATVNLEHARLRAADLAIVRGNTPRAVVLALDAGAWLPDQALQTLSRAFTENRLIALLHEGPPNPLLPLSAAIDDTGGQAATVDPAVGLRRWRLEGDRYVPEGPPRSYEAAFHTVLYAVRSGQGGFYAVAPEGVWHLPVAEGAPADFRCGADAGSVAEVSPDGRYVALGHALAPDRYAVCLLDLDRPGDPVFDLALHRADIASLAFSADGSRLLTASRDGDAKLLDTADGKVLLTLPTEGTSSRRRRLARALFDPTGERIALISTDDAVWLYGTDGTLVRRLAEVEGRDGRHPVHQSDILDIAIAPDGRYLVAGDEDGQVVRWDLGEDASALVLGQHEQSVTRVRIAPDGRQALSSSLDGTARLWDLDSGRETAVFSHDGALSEARFSADGARAFTLSAQDGSARLWSLEPVSRLALHLSHPDHVSYLQFAPQTGEDEVQLATAGYDGKVRVWDLPKDGGTPPVEPSLVLAGHAGPVRRLAYSPDGGRLVSAGQDGTARVWELADGSGRERCRLEVAGKDGKARVARVLFDPTPAADWVLTASDARPNPLALWDADGCERLDGGEALDAPGTAVQALDVRALPDGVLAAVGLEDGRVRVMQRGANGAWRLLCERILHGLPVLDVTISPDGMRVASAGEDRWARVLTVAGCGSRHPQIADLSGHADKVRSVRFSPDGRYLVTASQDRTARVWTPEGTEVQVLPGHKNHVYYAEYSPDGRWILSSSRDGSVRLWRAPAQGDPPAASPFLLLTSDLRGVPYATFSPDGRDIGAAYWRNTAQLWRIWANDGDGTDKATLADIRATWGPLDAELVLLREAERFRRGNRLDDLNAQDDAARE